MKQADATPARSSEHAPRRFAVKNFTDAYGLEVIAVRPEETLPPLVRLFVQVESLTFQHSMRPEQARQLAEYLVTCAADAEASS